MKFQSIRRLAAIIRHRPLFHLAAAGLAGALLFFSNTGCRWIAGYDPAPCTPELCTANVVLYPDKAEPRGIQIDYSGVGKRLNVPDLVRFDNSKDPVPLYWWSSRPTFAPWVREGEVPPVLRGAWLVRVDVEDAGIGSNLMTLKFDDPGAVETVWVAFDRRGGAPDWLRPPNFASYEGELRSTQRTTKDEPVRYALWKLQGNVPARLSLGGNDDPTAQWSGKPGAQYLVFIRPKPVPDENGVSFKVGDHKFETCGRWLSDGDESTYLTKWVGKHPGWSWSKEAGLLGMTQIVSCEPITSTSASGLTQVKYCRGDGSFQSGLVNDWPLESWASVDPAGSMGRVGLDGDEPVQSPLRGEVSFRSLDDGRLILDEISLFAEPFSSGGHHVSEATFTHEAAIEATCTGQSFPHRLCDDYRVNEQGMQLYVAARVGSHQYSATIANEQPIGVVVDLNQRIFYFEGGPFTGAVLLENGNEIQVEASFDFLGRFENFAPVALADEGGDRFPCVDNRQGRVRLDAGASLDEEGTLTSYLWLENAGMSTQRLLGSTAVTEVDMAFGTHEATLFVEDLEGVISFTKKTVEVYDEVLETVSFPADVFAPSAGDLTQLTVPSATGSDGCSGQVLVLGDLPPEDLFPDGLSLVDWSVDDGNGNVARDTQKVFVLPPPFHPPPIAEVSSTPMVGFDGTLHIDYGTSPQGNGVTVDEYLIVTRYDGAQWSIDSRGRVGEQNQLRPRSSGLVLGVAASSGHVALTDPGDLFHEEGPYAIEFVLVRPGESPLERTSIVGWDGVGWTLVP